VNLSSNSINFILKSQAKVHKRREFLYFFRTENRSLEYFLKLSKEKENPINKKKTDNFSRVIEMPLLYWFLSFEKNIDLACVNQTPSKKFKCGF